MRIALAALLLLIAAPAVGHADWTPDAAALGRLTRGEVYAEVSPDPGGASGVVHGAVDIAAPPAVVWATIQDCGRANAMAPSVRSCRITENGPDGRWDVRELVVRWSGLTPAYTTRFRSDYDPKTRIRFRCTGGDISFCQGLWRLTPLPEGGTRVTYENRATSPIAAPPVITRVAMRRDVARALTALRRESEDRAAR